MFGKFPDFSKLPKDFKLVQVDRSVAGNGERNQTRGVSIDIMAGFGRL